MAQIVPRQEKFRIDYRKVTLPALFRKQDSDANFDSALPRWSSGFFKESVSKARLTVLFACEQIKEESLVQTIREQADKGVRIYLLLGDKNANKAVIDTLSGRCLIRTGVSQQGSLMLIDHGTNRACGVLLMSGEPLVAFDKSAWGVELEPQQIEDYFRSFCKLFWENSSDEYLQQHQNQTSVKHPDGQVLTNYSHHLSGELKNCLIDTLEQLDSATHSAFDATGDDWRLLLGLDSAEIAKVARTGVVLTDAIIPSLLLSSEGNWLLPDQTDLSAVNWCLKLSEDQGEKVKQAFDKAFAEAAWPYQKEAVIGELSEKQRVRFADQPNLECLIEDVRKIKLQDINTESIDSFLNDDVKYLTSGVTDWQRSQLARYIDYDVMVHPPYCPADAKQDALYQEWNKTEDDWQNRLEDLDTKQSKIDRQQESVSEIFKGFLKGFLLGQGQSAKKLNQEISSLKGWSVTKATPAERQEYIKRLKSLQDKIDKRVTDTEQELDKAEQNQSWDQKRDELTTARHKKSEILNKKSSDLEQLKNAKPEKLVQIRQAFRDSWSNAADQLNVKQLHELEVNGIKPEQFLKTTLPEIPQAEPKNANDSDKNVNEIAIKQAKSKREELLNEALTDSLEAKRVGIRSMDVDQANAWKKSMNDKIWKKHYSAFERCLKDHELGLKKIERDIQDALTAVEKCQSELHQVNKLLSEHGDSFTYKPQQQSGAFGKQLGLNSHQAEASPFQWPTDELPAEGTELRTQQNNRYLVIFELDMLDQARLDAERLNAKIVCDREKTNA